MLTCKQK